MGQCASSQASKASELSINEVVLDIRVAGQPGAQENTWQVRTDRRATIDDLKKQIFELYDMPVEMQVLRRTAGGPPLSGDEKLNAGSTDALHLSVRNPLESLVAALGGGGQMQGIPLADLTERMSSAIAEMNAIQESLQSAEYALKFVLPAQSKPRTAEKRCALQVAAVATVADVLDMVKLELNIENQRLALEFAGQTLPAMASIHMCGLSDGDTIMLVPAP